MYVDTNGYVTVGIGFMIPNAAAAKGYNFVKRSDGKKASDKEKEGVRTLVCAPFFRLRWEHRWRRWRGTELAGHRKITRTSQTSWSPHTAPPHLR